MPATYESNRWVVEIEITTPTANTYLSKCVTSGSYLLEKRLALTTTPTTSTVQQAGTTIINYQLNETEPTVAALAALDSLYTLFEYIVL